MSGIASNVPEGVKVRTDLVTAGPARHLRVTLTAAAGEPVETWSLDLRVPSPIKGSYGARCTAVGGTAYRVTPDPWNEEIPAGGQVEFGVFLH